MSQAWTGDKLACPPLDFPASSIASCVTGADAYLCLDLVYVEGTLGNGDCDDLLNCAQFGFDAGDCL